MGDIQGKRLWVRNLTGPKIDGRLQRSRNTYCQGKKKINKKKEERERKQRTTDKYYRLQFQNFTNIYIYIMWTYL